jgi:para-nitrobenzyl esterase
MSPRALITALALSSVWTVIFADTTIYDERNTTKGSVRGILNQTNYCREWRGVFFAADTSGSNRFMPPQERKPWAPDVLDATTFAAGCPQIHHNPDIPTNQSEDCLNVNVFAPDYCESPESCNLPVLIWYHGGTFTEGWNEGPFDLYDGCNLAHGNDIIVVTSNYRLGEKERYRFI